jgi:hypothetical protein
MPLVDNLVEGFASAAGATDTVNAFEKKKAQKTQLSDQERQSNLDLYNQALDKITTSIGQIDPAKRTPDNPQWSSLNDALHKTISARTALFHPEYGPGAMSKLAEMLHLEKPGEKAQAAPGISPADALSAGASDPEAAKRDATLAWAQKHGVTGDALQELTEKILGVPASTWSVPSGDKPFQSTADGKWYRKVFDKQTGTFRDEPMGEGYQPPTTEKLRETLEPDKNSPTGYSKVSYDLETGNEKSRQLNALPPRGLISSESTTTDPFGVSSTTVRKPILPGTASGPAGSAGIPQNAGEARKAASPTNAPRAGAQGVPKNAGEARSMVSKPAQLDAQGHIPSTAKVNPQLREAANQLMDGMDLEKMPIPQRDREAAAQLARQYGWKGQGLFNPKEQLLLRESSTFLKKMLNDPGELAIYDLPTEKKAMLIPLLNDPDKEGIFANVGSLIASNAISQKEADALAAYRQLVGTVAGLSQLTKGGRATEAQIQRLKQELPNIMQTKNSTDAKARLGRLLSEIDIATQKGQFTDGTQDVSDDDFIKKF